MGAKRWGKDDLRLTLWWGTAHLNVLAKRLSRTPSAVYQRGVILGLTARNRDAKSLHALAREFGVCPGTLKAILDRAGVRKTNTTVDPRARAEKFVSLRYNPEKARAAFEHHLSTETATGYATRMGRDDGWIRRRLVKAGLWEGKRHRYLTSTLDKVCREFVSGQGSNFRSGQHLRGQSASSAASLAARARHQSSSTRRSRAYQQAASPPCQPG